MERVFVSWSGGKDCCLACYRAVNSGLKVRYLANMVTQDGLRSCSHGVLAKVIQAQAKAMDIPIAQRQTTQETYETVFKSTLHDFKLDGVEGGVFGDIDFEEHREWIERVCQAVDITPHLPLWGESQSKLLREFIDAGFEAVVVATRADMLGEEWLGRKLDRDCLRELEGLNQTRGITVCGEAGEYHTLVIDGPLFQKRLEIREAQKVRRGEHWFLEILDTGLQTKSKK